MSPAEDLIRRFAERRPLAVRLAEVVSLAVLVDPPLLRRARRLFVPEADAGTEADLWLSPLVRTRSPHGVSFSPEVAQELRQRLHDSGRLDDAWEMTCELHGHLPPALQLEEEIAWLSVSEDPGAWLEDIAAAERSLIAQIAARFPEIASAAEGRNLREVLEGVREQDLLSPEPLVLVVDAIDSSQGGNPAEFLLLLDLPGVVVVSSGAGGNLTKYLTLTPSEEALRAFWRHHGQDLRLKPAEIESALRASEGNFGLAQVLRRWLETGSRDFFEADNGRGAFQQVWEKLGEIPGQDRRNIWLGVLAAARAPLPESLVLRLLGDSRRETFAPLVRKGPAPFPEGEPVWELLEEVLRELIADRIDLKIFHRVFAEAVTSESVLSTSSPQVREYELRHGIVHWLEAGEPEHAYRLCTDTDFLTAGCREIGPEAVRRSLEEWLELEGHTDRVLACNVTRDGHLAVSGSADRTLRLWDLWERRALAVLSGHDDEVTGCAFTPDGSRVISRSLDGTLGIWEARTGALLFRLRGHTGWVNAFALDEDRNVLYSCSEDETVRAWDLATGEQRGVVYGVSPFRSLAVTYDGVCAGDEAGNFWVLEYGEGGASGGPFSLRLRSRIHRG